jgi:hypothetical protein
MKETTPLLFNDLVPEELQPPMALDVFIKRIGITATTAWRWRKAGTLKTINIYGRQYVPARAIKEFNRRADAGEFQQEHKTPSARKRAAGKATK